MKLGEVIPGGEVKDARVADGFDEGGDRVLDEKLPDDYVFETQDWLRVAAQETLQIPPVLRRTDVGRREYLYRELSRSEDLSDPRALAGLVRSNALKLVSREELMSLILSDRKNCGIGMTPGGDCAGISDMLYAFSFKLEELAPERRALAVPGAGKGLPVSREDFERSLIYLDHLVAEDLRGMPGTPFGTSRGNPLAVDKNRVIENLRDFGFLYGSGGNGGLKLFAEIASALPNVPIVAAPKTIDGDISVNGGSIQSLGFSTAVDLYRQEIFGVEATNEAVGGVNIVEVFGRDGGMLAFESARTDGVVPVGQVVDSRILKLMRRRAGSMMLLLPEKPVSLENIARRIDELKASQGHCTVVVAEGFMPPDLKSMILELVGSEELRGGYLNGTLDANGLVKFLQQNFINQDFLIEILKDREQAEFFLNMLYGKSGVTISADFAEVRIPAVRRFLIEAVKRFSGERPRRSLLSYEARGALPNRHDRQMGLKLGEKMAQLVKEGRVGGHVVYYNLGESPFSVPPQVAPLSEVGTGNALDMYEDDILRANGVFWR